MDDALTRFQAGWQDYHGLTGRYKRRQINELRELAATHDDGLLAISAAELQGWLEDAIGDGKAASTVGQKLIYVRPFFTWAFNHQLIDAERFLAIRGVKPPRNTARAEPRPYSEREREQFWQDFDRRYPWVRDVYHTAAQYRDQQTEARGRMFFERWLEGRSSFARARPYCLRVQAEAMVALAMVGGLRRVEIWTLELDDMDADNEYVIVQGARKGNGREKERAVPWLTDGMRAAVDRWLSVRAEVMAHDCGRPHDRPWLFLYINGFGRPGDRMRWHPFDRTLRMIGPYSWHRMRHTAATEMFRAGYQAPTVQKILGHADINTTMRYVKLLREDVVHQARINQTRYERAMGRR